VKLFEICSFAPTDIDEPSISTKWLYEHVSEIWKPNLPPCALETVRNGGYYTALIRPGLRLIALNNNVCFTINWWIIYSVKSIASQFQWLHDVLLLAEQAGEKVHILAHIPNGDEDFHQPCSREFNRIVDRFHETIVAQFNGHVEVFGFNVFYSKTTENLPVNIAWNGGSIATFSGVNRNYNVYNVDPVTYVRC
jgi:sphingomyelin phosphodiesterase